MFTCLPGYLDAELAAFLLEHDFHGGGEDGEALAVRRVAQDYPGTGHARVVISEGLVEAAHQDPIEFHKFQFDSDLTPIELK